MDRPAPVLQIEISGPHRGGKSVLASLLQTILAEKGIVATFNRSVDFIRKDDLKPAIANLRKRGLAITVNEVASQVEQTDATAGFKR